MQTVTLMIGGREVAVLGYDEAEAQKIMWDACARRQADDTVFRRSHQLAQPCKWRVPVNEPPSDTDRTGQGAKRSGMFGAGALGHAH